MNMIYIYMIGEHVLLIKFLNGRELIFCTQISSIAIKYE